MLSLSVEAGGSTLAHRPSNSVLLKNRELLLSLHVESLALGGDGVARLGAEHGNRAVFVPSALPGEKVRARIDLSRKPARGRVLEILEASPDRVEPACKEAGRCGGCDLFHLRTDAQPSAHAEMVRSSLSRAVSQLPQVVAHPAPRTERYRTRARLAIFANGARPQIGYRRARSHRVHDIDDCLVLDERLGPMLGILHELLTGERGEGEASIALGESSLPVLELRWKGELGGKVFANLEGLVQSKALAGADVWIGNAKTPARIGAPDVWTVGGDGEPVFIRSGGFAQAHPETSLLLVKRALALLEPEGKNVLELFAGSGNFTVALARKARSVVAVEADAAACEAARRNLRARKLEAKVVTADADAFEIPAKTKHILLDPPRAGAPAASRRIAESRAQRVVYVSCDPGTLARDLRTLSEGGFRVTAVETFEMFPHTSHVETLVALDRAR